MPASYEAVVELTRQRREAALALHLSRDARLVSFAPGRIQLNLGPAAPRDLPARLQSLLGQWTGRRWAVSISDLPGEQTLHESLQDSLRADPLVQAVLETFPGATVGTVRARATAPGDGPDLPGAAAGGTEDDPPDLDDAMPETTGDPFADAFTDDGYDFGDDDT